MDVMNIYNDTMGNQSWEILQLPWGIFQQATGNPYICGSWMVKISVPNWILQWLGTILNLESVSVSHGNLGNDV
jgi:hypothetical protein